MKSKDDAFVKSITVQPSECEEFVVAPARLVKSLQEQVAQQAATIARLEGERDEARKDASLQGERRDQGVAEVMRLSRIVTQLEARLTRLTEGLRPFATFAKKWNAKPLNGISDAFYTIHAGEDGASLRLSDCRKALTLLANDPAELP